MSAVRSLDLRFVGDARDKSLSAVEIKPDGSVSTEMACRQSAQEPLFGPWSRPRHLVDYCCFALKGENMLFGRYGISQNGRHGRLEK